MAKIKVQLQGTQKRKTARRAVLQQDMVALKNANAAQQKEILARVLMILDEMLADDK